MKENGLEQIQLNIDSDKAQEESKTEDFARGETAARKTRLKDPKSFNIDSNVEVKLDDDIELVSPDEQIFKQVADRLADSEKKSKANIEQWTHAEEKEEPEIEYDDTYASTAQTDREFMSAFGIGQSTNQTISIDEKTNQTTSEIEALQGDIHSDYYEYTSRLQRKEIIGMYKYAKKSIETKLIISSVFAFLLFVIENMSLFLNNPTGILNIQENAYLYCAIDMVLLIGCIACAYEQMYHGFLALTKRDFIPETIVVLTSFVGILYSILSISLISLGNTVRLYNFPSAFLSVVALLYSYINVKREKYGFSVVSSKDLKFVMTNPEKSEYESESESFEDTKKKYDGNMARIQKTGFVKNYFANTNSSVNIGEKLWYFCISSTVISIALAVVSLFRHYNIVDALSLWYICELLTLPLITLFLYSVPFFVANKRLFENEVSILGEQAIRDYSKINAVSVNDTTAFPPYNVKMQNLKVYEGFTVENVMYYAASAFGVVGGPLSEVFDVATKDAFQKSRRAKYICSGRSYLVVSVDSKQIMFGDKFGITSQGIEITPEKEEREDVSILYMAIDSKICAKMYLRYKIDKEFIAYARILIKNGISIGIRTFDPCISNDMVKYQTGIDRADLKVIHLFPKDKKTEYTEKEDCPVVSKGLSKSLLMVLPMCKKIVKTRKVGFVLNILSSLLGVTFTGLIIFNKLTFLPSVVLVGFYIFISMIMMIITAINIPQKKQ